MPSRSSSTATSAFAPTASEPRSLEREHLRSIRSDHCDHLIERNPEKQEFRHDIRQIDHPGRTTVGVVVGRQRVRQETLPYGALRHVPGDMAVLAVAEIEPDAAPARRLNFGEQLSVAVEDAVRFRR